MIGIKLYLTGHIVPYTEISGNRPVLFNPYRQTTYIEFKEYVNKFKLSYQFKEVKSGTFQYKRDNLIDAVINIDSTKYNWLEYNYAIIELNGKILLYYINKVIPIQNNVNRLILKLDTISTYFWKLPIDKLVEVDRLNYSTTSHKFLLRETAKCKDETIGNIIKDRKLIIKPKRELYLNKYSYRKLTSNDIENMGRGYNMYGETGIILPMVNANSFKLESESNKVYYNYLKPLHLIYLYYNSSATIKLDFSTFKLIKQERAGGSYNYKLTYTVKRVDSEEVEKFILFTHLNTTLYEINPYIFYKRIVEEQIEQIRRDNELSGVKKLLFLENNYSKTLWFYVPYNFDFLPPIPEVVDISLYSWTGTSIPISYFNMNNNGVNIKMNVCTTQYEEKTYISLLNGVNTIGNSAISNKIELCNMLSLEQRIDTKTEYLAANANQIQMEKKVLRDTSIFNTFYNISSMKDNAEAGALSVLTDNLSGALSAKSGIKKNIFNIAGTWLNYTNKVKMINSRIEDIGNKRSQFNGGESGDYVLLSHNDNTKYFNEDGLNLVVKIPSGLLYEKLKLHFHKFGYKVSTYLTIKECFDSNVWSSFIYIKFNDLSNILPSAEIPQEALDWMNDILLSGIHFWKDNKTPIFNIPKGEVSVFQVYDGKDTMELKEGEIEI